MAWIKENFKEMDAQESQRLVRGQKDRLDYEVRKFRRRRLVQYHDLEQDLLREVRLRMGMVRGNLSDIIDFQELNKRQLQLESAHNMLLRHHEMTQVRLIKIGQTDDGYVNDDESGILTIVCFRSWRQSSKSRFTH